MKLNLVIIHLDMVVDNLELTPGKYTLGRSKESNIVVQHFSLHRDQGLIYFEEGSWYYKDTQSGQVKTISDLEPVILSDHISVATNSYVENEKTHIGDLSQVSEQFKEDRRKKIIIVAAIIVFLVGAPMSLYQLIWGDSSGMDPNSLLSQVRKQVVEFEAVKDQRVIKDLKSLAGLEDKDFKDSVGFCTGFLVAPNVILTAAHCLFGTMVIDLNNEFEIKTSDGKKHKIKRVLGYDIKRDFLFLESEKMESYGYLEFADQYKQGQKVFTVGNVHGEGIAIRDGLVASETPDLNDPDIKFIRYSAEASPGNSGGPLLDANGQVVALVFASTWTENYNLGTGADDLKKGFDKFVKNKKKKKVVIEVKKLLNYNPQSLLAALSLPYLQQFEEFPEIVAKFNDLKIEMDLPIKLSEIDDVVLSKLNKEVIGAYLSVQKILKKKKELTLDWTSFLSKKTPAILPSQFDSSQNSFVKVGERYHPKISGFIDSPSKADLTKYLDQLKKKNQFDFQAYGYNISYSDKNFGLVEGDIFYKPKNRTGQKRRLQTLSRGVPYSQMLIRKEFDSKKNEYPISMELFLQNFMGEQGVLANTHSRYTRPKSAKDFTLYSLTPRIKESTVKDKMGRYWKRNYFRIFENTNVFSYCHLLPEGSICMGRIFNVSNKYLLKVIENNFRKFVLSHLLVNPYFWKKDALQDFVSNERNKGMKSIQGLKFEKKEGGTWVRLSGFPFRFEIPDYDKVESIRVQTGLFGNENQATWTGYGVEWIKRDVKGDELCGIGLEPFESQASYMLNYLRERRKQEEMKKMKGDDPDPLPGIWYKLFRGLEKPFQIFGYCAPLVKDPRVDNNYFADVKKSKPLVYDYEIL